MFPYGKPDGAPVVHEWQEPTDNPLLLNGVSDVFDSPKLV